MSRRAKPRLPDWLQLDGTLKNLNDLHETEDHNTNRTLKFSVIKTNSDGDDQRIAAGMTLDEPLTDLPGRLATARANLQKQLSPPSTTILDCGLSLVEDLTAGKNPDGSREKNAAEEEGDRVVSLQKPSNKGGENAGKYVLAEQTVDTIETKERYQQQPEQEESVVPNSKKDISTFESELRSKERANVADSELECVVINLRNNLQETLRLQFESLSLAVDGIFLELLHAMGASSSPVPTAPSSTIDEPVAARKRPQPDISCVLLQQAIPSNNSCGTTSNTISHMSETVGSSTVIDSDGPMVSQQTFCIPDCQHTSPENVSTGLSHMYDDGSPGNGTDVVANIGINAQPAASVDGSNGKEELPVESIRFAFAIHHNQPNDAIGFGSPIKIGHQEHTEILVKSCRIPNSLYFDDGALERKQPITQQQHQMSQLSNESYVTAPEYNYTPAITNVPSPGVMMCSSEDGLVAVAPVHTKPTNFDNVIASIHKLTAQITNPKKFPSGGKWDNDYL